jgi:hypothetical protein
MHPSPIRAIPPQRLWLRGRGITKSACRSIDQPTGVLNCEHKGSRKGVPHPLTDAGPTSDLPNIDHPERPWVGGERSRPAHLRKFPKKIFAFLEKFSADFRKASLEVVPAKLIPPHFGDTGGRHLEFGLSSSRNVSRSTTP